MTALIDFCLLINLAITVVMFLLMTEPEMLIHLARRRSRAETSWFDDASPPGHDDLAIIRLWTRWMWVVLIAWGLMTGFLVGLYWQGWFWRF